MLIVDYDAPPAERVKFVKEWNFQNRFSACYLKGSEKKYMLSSAAHNGQIAALHNVSFNNRRRISARVKGIQND